VLLERFGCCLRLGANLTLHVFSDFSRAVLSLGGGRGRLFFARLRRRSIHKCDATK